MQDDARKLAVHARGRWFPSAAGARHLPDVDLLPGKSSRDARYYPCRLFFVELLPLCEGGVVARRFPRGWSEARPIVSNFPIPRIGRGQSRIQTLYLTEPGKRNPFKIYNPRSFENQGVKKWTCWGYHVNWRLPIPSANLRTHEVL